MTQKINGAAYPGIWVEKHVAFIKVTFNIDISALPAADLTLLNTATAVTGNAVADSTFGIVESAIVQALKTLETKATVLGVSKYDVSSTSVDVMVGVSEGWFSDVNGVIATGLPVLNAVAKVTTAGTNVAVGDNVSVIPSAVTFGLSFSAFRVLPAATVSAGDIELGTGASSGALPVPGSSTGNPGYYPVSNMHG